MNEKVNVLLSKEEIELIIGAIDYLNYEFDIEDSPEFDLREKLYNIVENQFHRDFDA
ncbi:hypothetical protein G4V62_08415 [Bacillaceae bacterium SIJ1]|uniref:hypothetical protein n=1 Tax=Litoribacterium kuwaitense TaxID=1398745 RepID=UPI0013EDB057|nr:hypothetical protein [Litoribacterium kuwaitense]NGP44981.1 hypothetical protein [Litoribacterium kuwaitense]